MKQIIIMVLIIAAAIIIGTLVAGNLETANSTLMGKVVTKIGTVNP